MRDIIVAKVLKSTFDDRVLKLKAFENDLANAVLKDTIGKHSDAFYSLPDMFVDSVEYIQPSFAGQRQILQFYDENGDVVSQRVPILLSKYGGKSYAATHKFSAVRDIFNKKSQDYKDELSSMNGKIRALVYSCSSLKKLYEVWPEAKEYTTGMDNPSVPLPAILGSELNSLIRDAKLAA